MKNVVQFSGGKLKRYSAADLEEKFAIEEAQGKLF